jgi:hypothetical protein
VARSGAQAVSEEKAFKKIVSDNVRMKSTRTHVCAKTVFVVENTLN